jgi:hypothetical protein
VDVAGSGAIGPHVRGTEGPLGCPIDQQPGGAVVGERGAAGEVTWFGLRVGPSIANDGREARMGEGGAAVAQVFLVRRLP